MLVLILMFSASVFAYEGVRTNFDYEGKEYRSKLPKKALIAHGKLDLKNAGGRIDFRKAAKAAAVKLRAIDNSSPWELSYCYLYSYSYDDQKYYYWDLKMRNANDSVTVYVTLRNYISLSQILEKKL